MKVKTRYFSEDEEEVVYVFDNKAEIPSHIIDDILQDEVMDKEELEEMYGASLKAIAKAVKTYRKNYKVLESESHQQKLNDDFKTYIKNKAKKIIDSIDTPIPYTVEITNTEDTFVIRYRDQSN